MRIDTAFGKSKDIVTIKENENKILCNAFFFFQAEDGIRDLTVTGVQTCALPISRRYRQSKRAHGSAAIQAAQWRYRRDPHAAGTQAEPRLAGGGQVFTRPQQD